MPKSSANVSNQLVWQVIKPYSSFKVKQTNGPLNLTREPNNPANVHSYKYSSIAQQNQILSVEAGEGYDIEVVECIDDKFAEFKPRTLLKTKVLKDGGGPLRNNTKLAAALDKSFYRGDLKSIVLQRYTKLYRAAQKTRKNRASK